MFDAGLLERPELAVALNGNGATPKDWVLNGPKVIVCGAVPVEPRVMVKPRDMVKPFCPESLVPPAALMVTVPE